MSCACCSPAPAGPSTSEKRHPFISTALLAQKCVLDDKTAKSFKYRMVGANGAFNNAHHILKLPVEIFRNIIKQLDINSLFTFRLCSQYCRLRVSSLLEWQEISNSAPEAFRAILSTGIGHNVLLLQLHYALTHPECGFCEINFDRMSRLHEMDPEFCGYFDGEKVMGGFLSLFEGKRACAYCLRNHPSLKCIDYFDLIQLSHQDSAVRFPPDLRYPRIQPIPDTYGPLRHKLNQPLQLVSSGSIEMIPGKPISFRERSILQIYNNVNFIPEHPYTDRQNVTAELIPDGFEFEGEDQVIRRYMTAIPFPYFGKTKTHPSTKQRVTFHVCQECYLNARYYELQYLEAVRESGACEEAIECAGRLYTRETRVWLNDMEAEKEHTIAFHRKIKGAELKWRKDTGARIFNLKHPETWKKLRVYEPHPDYKVQGRD